MRSGSQFSASGAAPRALGQVEYRLARNALIKDYQRGRLSQNDICDAQTELLRVATNLGEPTEEDCPICEENKLVHVSFAFGPGLPPSGRALETLSEMRRFARDREIACYVIEVCTNCKWNHLLRQLTSESFRRRITR